MDWFYAVNQQRQGPVSQADFDQLVRAGAIQPDTLVWRKGMLKWEPYGTLFAPTADGPDNAGDTAVCVVSGKRYPKREMVCFEGRWISAEHRDTYFQRLREGVAQPGQYTYGNFGRRFVAKFIDGLALYALTIPLNLVCAALVLGTWDYFGYRIDPNQAGAFGRFMAFQGLIMVVNIAVGLVYQIFFLSRFSATPGKLALGLKVVRADGSPLTKGRIVGRYFAELVSGLTFMIGYIMAGFDEERRSLHDRICDTRVVKPKQS